MLLTSVRIDTKIK